jgi:anti-anti-sigma factor
VAFVRRQSDQAVAQRAAGVSRDGERTVVLLRGEQDLATVSVLAERLAMAIAVDEDDLVVDLADVEFIDDAMVGVLQRGRDFLQLRSRHLVLRAPSTAVRSVLDTLGLADLIDARSAHAAR